MHDFINNDFVQLFLFVPCAYLVTRWVYRSTYKVMMNFLTGGD